MLAIDPRMQIIMQRRQCEEKRHHHLPLFSLILSDLSTLPHLFQNKQDRVRFCYSALLYEVRKDN